MSCSDECLKYAWVRIIAPSCYCASVGYKKSSSLTITLHRLKSQEYLPMASIHSMGSRLAFRGARHSYPTCSTQVDPRTCAAISSQSALLSTKLNERSILVSINRSVFDVWPYCLDYLCSFNHWHCYVLRTRRMCVKAYFK